jgi:hypothetical protein
LTTNGQHVEEADDAGEDETAEFLEFMPCTELARQTGLGRRFIVTLAEQGHVRRRSVGNGWHYCLADCQAYKRKTGTAVGDSENPRETELQTLVNGYKELLGLQNAALKQAQAHERELFSSFTAPLGVLTAAMQAQVQQLTERANSGDKARIDFMLATETLLRDQRAEHAEIERTEATRVMRTKMWDDVKRAAPHVWTGIQQTLGVDAGTIERLRAAATLREKLDKSKVAALFAFDFLSEEEKALLCTAFGYERAELDAMARDAGAHEAAAEPAAEAAPERHEHVGEVTIDRATGVETCDDCNPELRGD